jgi:hypothetical protein
MPGPVQTFIQMLPYFSRLTAYGPDGGLRCSYPSYTPEEVEPTPEEQEFLSLIQVTGGVQTTPVHRGPGGSVILSFMSHWSPLPEASGRGFLWAGWRWE